MTQRTVYASYYQFEISNIRWGCATFANYCCYTGYCCEPDNCQWPIYVD